MAIDLESRIYGCLLGGLIGDAMGAPVEGKTFEQIEREYGPDGVLDFEGEGTDDTAIRNQLISAILAGNGVVDCDTFAATFLQSWTENYSKWWVPVRNMAHKIRNGAALPVDAGYGNTASSSSAMAISPLGMLNAANPRQAALETFDVAGLIHSGPTGFCRDAACAMAAAVAGSFSPGATVSSVLQDATRHLHSTSAAEMLSSISNVLALAEAHPDYKSFRSEFYGSFLRDDICDSRETVPVALAIFAMSNGVPKRAIRYGANFGRDADTIATMVGGLCGSFCGHEALPEEWVRKVEANRSVKLRDVSCRFAEVVRSRARSSVELAWRVLDGEPGND